jgi:two-component system sensor histidine kinase/response regulator
MIVELDSLRTRFGGFLVFLFWAHVPVLAIVARLNGMSPSHAALAGAALAAAYHLTWWRSGIAPTTRYLSAVALMAEPAILLFLLHGDAWQMDMHMYFFAMLALTIAWCDRGAIIVAATAVALHHLLLLFLLPYADFPNEGNLERVLFHAVIVAFQTAALVWLCNMLVTSFHRIDGMRHEILAKNETLEERTREAEGASKAKSMFLANMSHEIRTPMNAILGFCHLVGRTELGDKQRDYVVKINDSAMSLLRLINDILDFSKNEAGKLMLEARPFNPRAAIARQIQLVSQDADAKGVRILSQIDPALPETLVGDELRLAQIVINLLSNAVKFSSHGDVTVGLELQGQHQGRATIEMFVRDHGIGIPIEQQVNLFNSFTQADSTTTRKFGGTGLGLAICRQIVEQMDGNIRVDSVPGEGSTFTCRFVMALEDKSLEADLRPSAHVRSLRILAADDNPAARQIMQEIFERWGMTIDLVASGTEAIAACREAAAREADYDLVMLDWKMPGMDGMEAVRQLQQSQAVDRMPVTLIVTAYGTDDLAAQASQTGVSAFLSKPMDPRVLLDTINTLFSTADDHAPATMALPTVAAGLRGLRVLLVEDNEINREIASELLADAGLIVDCAENGRIACDRIKTDGSVYAAILMDVQMPEMDGIEATRIIRRDWASDRLPIIAMTAHAFEEERQRCFAAGMNDHVAKPVDPAVLMDTLNRWLQPTDKVAPSAPARNARAIASLPRNLPPFDIEAALRRVNGKTALLHKLIVQFGRSYASVTNELRVQISTGLVADSRRVAHSLKGVAGSLELSELQAAAAILEELLATGATDQALDALSDLEKALAPAIHAARSIDAEPESGSPPPATVASSLVTNAAWSNLHDLVSRRSLGARAAFDELAGVMGLSEADRARHPLHQALERLDYEAALTLIDNHLRALEYTI